MFFFGLVLSVSIIFIIYEWFRQDYGQLFKRQGIPYIKPLPIIGNLLGTVFRQEGPQQFLHRLYSSHSDAKIVGVFGLFKNPAIIIKDLNFIKKITTKDFDHFYNRGVDADKVVSTSITMLCGQEWRVMRKMLNPIFSTLNMKDMLGIFKECLEEFMEIYEAKAILNGGEIVIDTQDAFSRLSTDQISSGIGIKANCLKNKKSEIFMITKAFEKDLSFPVVTFLCQYIPGIIDFLGLSVFNRKGLDVFFSAVKREINNRRMENNSRIDIIQLLMQEKLKPVDSEARSKLTDDDLASQAFGFFIGGYDPTAKLMELVCYELAVNPEIQETLMKEVDEMHETLKGKSISYYELNEMKFLKMVVTETLRKWPIIVAAFRICTKNYELFDEETGRVYTIEKGMKLIIPIQMIQMDPKHFPNPENFDPYRFSDASKSEKLGEAYSAFGFGPRGCIGKRLAMLIVNLMLFNLLSKFKIEKCLGTPEKPAYMLGISGFLKMQVCLKLRK